MWASEEGESPHLKQQELQVTQYTQVEEFYILPLWTGLSLGDLLRLILLEVSLVNPWGVTLGCGALGRK